MLPREQIRGVNMLVAEQTELGGISSTVKNRDLLVTEIAGDALPSSGLRTDHFSSPAEIPEETLNLRRLINRRL